MKPWTKFDLDAPLSAPAPTTAPVPTTAHASTTALPPSHLPLSMDQPPALPIQPQFNRQPQFNPYQSQYQGQYQPYNQYGQGYSQNSQYGQGYNQYSQFNQSYQPQNIGQGTQQAFFVLEQLVQTISGFSQMLDSTFHATQSSFMAMLGLAEQFSIMRKFLASTLSLANIVDSLKKLVGAKPDDKERRTSKIPVLLFILATFGFPFLMSKLLKSLEARQQSDLPVNLVFAQALFDFRPNSQGELSFAKGDIIGVLDKCLEAWNPGVETAWWRGRLQSGAVGIFPANYVKLIDQPT